MCAGIATLVLGRKIVYGCIGMCIGCSVNHIELSDKFLGVKGFSQIESNF